MNFFYPNDDVKSFITFFIRNFFYPNFFYPNDDVKSFIAKRCTSDYFISTVYV
jgi:hypothetical protein